MNTMTTTDARMINGINVDNLRGAIKAIAAEPAQGMTRWGVETRWMGGTRSDTKVTGYMIGGRQVDKDFTIRIDEPLELCGTNRHANPQEYLMAALNACMTVGYVSACAMEGIELEELRIETGGEIDLRGFLGIDASVKPGYDKIRYTVHMRGNGTPEQFAKVHETVSRLSPNRFNVATAIPMEGTMVID